VRYRDLVIIGASGNGREIIDAIASGGQADGVKYRPIGFLDDKQELWGTSLKGATILGGLGLAHKLTDAFFVNAIGGVNSYVGRPALTEKLGIPEERFATIIHSSAVISPDARIGVGSVVLANAVVGSDSVIGRHVLMLPHVVVNHDVVVDDYAILASSVCVAGYAQLGRASYIGMNAAIRDRVRVGAEALVGMGAVVLRDVPPGSVVVGVPAAEVSRPMR
jgi:sugar O-acyltransferase (sialic acid O-acetyltransferase NeuD family)